MAVIEAVGTAVPRYRLRQSEAKQLAARLFNATSLATERYLTVFDHAAIDERYVCVPPEWFEMARPLSEKNRLYVQAAGELGVQAVERCLAMAGRSADEIDHLIVVSSTGLATPSLDAHFINRMPFRNDVRRTPVWGLGCAGGAAGLTLACEWIQAHPHARALLVAVECCSLTFQRHDMSKRNLVAAALFADGAAAVLVAGDKTGAAGPRWLGSMSHTWRNSLELMGWQVADDGLEVVFSKDIPVFVRRRLRPVVHVFLRRHGLSGTDDLRHVIAHPGGVRVLEALIHALPVEWSLLAASKAVLKRYGNMSSPTVLFVLQEVFQSRPMPGDYGLLLALGPGFSAEQLLLAW